MRQIRILAPLTFFLAAAACNSGGAAQALRPSDPTYAGATDATQCKDASGYGEPLVVDWRPELRADLEIAMRSGVAVVKYDCHTLQLLKDCTTEGSYGFVGINRKEQVLRFDNGDDIRANLPFSGGAIAADLNAELARGTTLDVALVMVGAHTTTRASVARGTLNGMCTGATHFVRRATVGAFSMQTGTRADVASAASLFGASVATKSSSHKSVHNTDGDLAACAKSRADALTATDQCGALMKLDLTPIEGATTAVAANDTTTACPAGFVMSQGKCTTKAAEALVACKGDNVDECLAQCTKGEGISCGRAAWGLSKANPTRALELWDRGCELGNGWTCHDAAWAHYGGSGTQKNIVRGEAVAARSCDLGFATGCNARGQMYDAAGDAKKATDMFLRACLLGEPVGCSNAGMNYSRGNGVAQDNARALDLTKKACDGNSNLGCVNLGEWHHTGTMTPKNDVLALPLFEKGCELGRLWGCVRAGQLHRDGAGTVKNLDRAKDFLRKACSGPQVDRNNNGANGAVEEGCRELSALIAR